MSLPKEILWKKQKLGIDEENLIKLESDGFANIIDPRFGISRKKVIALKLLLYNFKHNQESPSRMEKKIVQEFLLNIRGDMEFNKELQQIARMELTGKARGAILVGDLIQYTYKTRHIANFNEDFKKLENLNRSSEEQKLTLREYANIYELVHIKPFLEQIFVNGLLENHELLLDFYNKIVICYPEIMKIQDKYKMVNTREQTKQTQDKVI
jgi:hypothetical protein